MIIITISFICRGGGMADAAGLKPAASKMACGFESHPRYHYFIPKFLIIEFDISSTFL